jgi:NADP-dependent 3-hydroxy acid dehydrogenase YdfG
LIRTLARLGSTVYAAARTPGRLCEANLPAAVIPIAMDLANPHGIDATIAQLNNASIVINNAGVNRGGPRVVLPG